jgi:thiol-disulfide isomerase/thioredoxin
MNYLPFIGGAVLALAVIGRPGHRGVKGASTGEVRAGAKVAAADTTYTLHGQVAGLDTGWVFLYHPGDGPIDSTVISHGKFDFAGSVTEPQFCHLIFKKLNRDNIYSLSFFLQAGTLGLKGTKDSIAALVPSGAPIQQEYLQYSKKIDSAVDWQVWGHANELATAAKNKLKTGSLSAAATVMDNLQKQLAKDYATTHPSSYVAVYEVLSYFSYNPDAEELQVLYNGFAPEIQSSHLGTELKKVLDAALLTGVGRPAPVFTQADTKGRPVTLSSLKGQYVLVDFWASWCGPCRAENPNVLKSYRTYHSKGFTVLGVSLDDEKSPWLGAIKKDGLPWTEVSDLKGWKNSAAVLYGVEGIPMNFLLDKNGTIVAKGLRGDDLEKKLAEFLH